MEPGFCMQDISDDSADWSLARQIFEYLLYQHGEESTVQHHILVLFNFIMHSTSVCNWRL